MTLSTVASIGLAAPLCCTGGEWVAEAGDGPAEGSQAEGETPAVTGAAGGWG